MGRKKTEIKLKEPVRIREARRSDGNISLYLDIYSKGMRKREGLKHYLVPEINSAAKVQNANTRKLAEQIKAQRILDIQTKGLGRSEAFTHAPQGLANQVFIRRHRAATEFYAVEAQRTGESRAIP